MIIFTRWSIACLVQSPIPPPALFLRAVLTPKYCTRLIPCHTSLNSLRGLIWIITYCSFSLELQASTILCINWHFLNSCWQRRGKIMANNFETPANEKLSSGYDIMKAKKYTRGAIYSSLWSYMADEDAFSSILFLCVWHAASWGGRQSQNQGRAYLHLNVKEIVPYVFKIHILQTKVK